MSIALSISNQKDRCSLWYLYNLACCLLINTVRLLAYLYIQHWVERTVILLQVNVLIQIKVFRHELNRVNLFGGNLQAVNTAATFSFLIEVNSVTIFLTTKSHTESLPLPAVISRYCHLTVHLTL